MNKRRLAAAFLVAAAAAPLMHDAQAQTSRSAGTTLGVRVVSGRVQINPVTQIRVSASSPSMTFLLQTPGYRFNNSSIDFGEWKEYFRCSAYNEGQGIRCTRTNNAPAGEFTYTVSVDADTGGTPDQSSPNGVIMLD